MRGTTARHITFSLIFVIAAVMVVACATLPSAQPLPPAQPATDLKSIAGKWHGTGTFHSTIGGIKYPITYTITEAGTYEAIAEGSRYVGTVRVSAGKFRSKSDTTGKTGTFTLHEGDGRRVLTTEWDGGGSWATLTPVKQ